MSVYTFNVTLKNGETFTRAEWGKNEKDAQYTLWDMYGENLERAVRKI